MRIQNTAVNNNKYRVAAIYPEHFQGFFNRGTVAKAGKSLRARI
jgi:hypothetical protein